MRKAHHTADEWPFDSTDAASDAAIAAIMADAPASPDAWAVRRGEAGRHQEQLVDAIRKYGGPDQRAIERQVQQLGRAAEADLPYMHPGAATVWARLLLRGIREHQPPLSNAHTLTLIDRRWFTDHNAFEFEPKVIARKITDRMRGFSYIGMIEFAVFPGYAVPGGKLVCPHFQGIVWGTNVNADAMAALNSRFAGGLGGTTGVHCQPVYDLAGAVRYAVKLPAHGYSYVPRRHRPADHFSTRLHRPMHYRLFKRLGGYTLPQLTVAGGDGVRIKRAAMRRAPAA